MFSVLMELDLVKQRRQKRAAQAQRFRELQDDIEVDLGEETPGEPVTPTEDRCPHCSCKKSGFKKFPVHLRHCRKRHGS